MNGRSCLGHGILGQSEPGTNIGVNDVCVHPDLHSGVNQRNVREKLTKPVITGNPAIFCAPIRSQSEDR